MSTLKMDAKYTKSAIYASTALFLAAAVIFFTQIQIPYKTAIPVAILTISSLWLCPWQITSALLFSAIGDCMGWKGEFICQMGFFAAAHIFYIIYFIKRYLDKVERDRKLSNKAKGYFAMVGFCTLALLATAYFKIAPGAEAGVTRTGVYIYATLISIMMVSALLQRSSLYALGAVIFVFSDFILAWNKFVEPVPYRNYLVLIPYYAAQWLFFIRSTKYRVAPEMRILRF